MIGKENSKTQKKKMKLLKNYLIPLKNKIGVFGKYIT
jgi:hypothetical protein